MSMFVLLLHFLIFFILQPARINFDPTILRDTMELLHRTPRETKTVFNRICHLRYAEARTNHHIKVLSHHLQNGTTPKGLNIKVNPSPVKESPTFRTECNRFCHQTESQLAITYYTHIISTPEKIILNLLFWIIQICYLHFQWMKKILVSFYT